MKVSGTYLAAGGTFGNVTVWRYPANGAPMFEDVKHHSNEVEAISWNQYNSNVFATYGEKSAVRLKQYALIIKYNFTKFLFWISL